MIPIKSEAELAIMRQAGRILADAMQKIRESVRAGITTKEIDNLAEKLILAAGARPAFLGYRGYPATICTSPNDQVVHGIPGQTRIVEGDILSLDLGLEYKGFFSDAAVTVAVGKIAADARKLIEVTRRSLDEGIRRARPGAHVSDISAAVQAYVEKNGCSVVRQFVGHGIGTNLHEEPEVPNFGLPGRGEVLEAGMVLAIEPMVNLGTWECEVLEDGWTAVTKDRRLSAHFEHTVAIGSRGPEILTKIR